MFTMFGDFNITTVSVDFTVVYRTTMQVDLDLHSWLLCNKT